MLCSSCSQTVKPVVAIDIDGTLGDHHGHFRKFAERYTNRILPDRPYPYDEEFSDWLGLPKELYRQVKLAYRQGGMKRLMPAFDFAHELVWALRNDGAEVWLCTTRPYLRLDNIDPDTREWLDRNGIGYDGLIYGEDKYHRLADIVGKERVIGVLDDLPEMFDEASDLSLKPIQKWNGHRGDGMRFPGESELDRVYKTMKQRLDEWRDDRE